jgi:hypothetical protein
MTDLDGLLISYPCGQRDHMYWFGTPPGDADARPWILVLLHNPDAGAQKARYHTAIEIVFEVVVTLP